MGQYGREYFHRDFRGVSDSQDLSVEAIRSTADCKACGFVVPATASKAVTLAIFIRGGLHIGLIT